MLDGEMRLGVGMDKNREKGKGTRFEERVERELI